MIYEHSKLNRKQRRQFTRLNHKIGLGARTHTYKNVHKAYAAAATTSRLDTRARKRAQDSLTRQYTSVTVRLARSTNTVPTALNNSNACWRSFRTSGVADSRRSFLQSGTVARAALEDDSGAAHGFFGDVGVGADALALGEDSLEEVSLHREGHTVLSPERVCPSAEHGIGMRLTGLQRLVVAGAVRGGIADEGSSRLRLRAVVASGPSLRREGCLAAPDAIGG